MVRYYCGVPEECTEEQAQHFTKILEKLGINIVFMHAECMLQTTLEKSVADVEEAERTHPTGSNFPLQPNCFYSYTPLEGTPSSTRHPIVKLLESHPKKARKSSPVFLSCTLPQERDYKDLPIEVFKDVTFVDEASRKEVGWYNKRTNIIWMSDIFHFFDNAKNLIPTIVDSIIEYNRYGRLPEVLTVGADPEFEVVTHDDNFVEAHTLFGENGCQPQTEIGYDGHSSTGELRPLPHRSPLGLTRNIKRLIRRLNGMRIMGDNKVWVGGGINVTTGGHIHFGMRGATQELKDLMYDMVAEPVLAFQSERRRTGEQSNWARGQSGNLRDQPHGCEWRPLPSFIVNEEITAAVLSTTYAIVKSWKYRDYKNLTRPITIEHYYKIPLYNAYKEQIDTFIRLFVKKEEKVVLNQKDIFSEWQVERIKKDYTVDIISQAGWLQNYFTPLNAKLKKHVKIEIRFSGDCIATFGIKGKDLEVLKRFADTHFLPEISVSEKLPKNQNRPVICLPGSWYHMTGQSKFCEDFKVVLKNIILVLGGQC
jgi:hypothetical protein